MQVITCIDEPDPNLVPRTRSYGDLTRRRILEAAERVFSREGFQGATTREIAREAQVNEVTLFRHFRTRDELVARLFYTAPLLQRIWLTQTRLARAINPAN